MKDRKNNITCSCRFLQIICSIWHFDRFDVLDQLKPPINSNFFPGTGQDRLSKSCPGPSRSKISKSCSVLACPMVKCQYPVRQDFELVPLSLCPRTMRNFLSLCPAREDCLVQLETLDRTKLRLSRLYLRDFLGN